MLESGFSQGVARAVIALSVPQVDAYLRFLYWALQRRPGAPVKALAYCFCGL